MVRRNIAERPTVALSSPATLLPRRLADREPLTVRASADRSRWLAAEILPHEAMLRAWLARSKVAGLEIDDIVQEAYAVLASLDSVAHIRNPRNYLFQTARSVVLRHLRRAQVVRFQALPDTTEAEIAQRDPSPEDAAIFRDRLRQADVLLTALPDRAREAFLLRRVQGLSQREIAARMNVSENTVEKHIGKALRLILHAVGASHGGNMPPQVSSPQNTTDGPEATVDKRTRLGPDRNE